MANESIKIADVFKVSSITLYGGYAQVNGNFLRQTEIAPSANHSFTFNVSLDEGKSLTPEVVYDFNLTPRVQPQPDTEPASPQQPAS